MYDSKSKYDEYKGNNINNQNKNNTLIFHLNPRVIETFLSILLNWAIIVMKLLYVYSKLYPNTANKKIIS